MCNYSGSERAVKYQYFTQKLLKRYCVATVTWYLHTLGINLNANFHIEKHEQETCGQNNQSLEGKILTAGVFKVTVKSTVKKRPA